MIFNKKIIGDNDFHIMYISLDQYMINLIYAKTSTTSFHFTMSSILRLFLFSVYFKYVISQENDISFIPESIFRMMRNCKNENGVTEGNKSQNRFFYVQRTLFVEQIKILVLNRSKPMNENESCFMTCVFKKLNLYDSKNSTLLVKQFKEAVISKNETQFDPECDLKMKAVVYCEKNGKENKLCA